jgi:hypothetical protein
MMVGQRLCRPNLEMFGVRTCSAAPSLRSDGERLSRALASQDGRGASCPPSGVPGAGDVFVYALCGALVRAHSAARSKLSVVIGVPT